MIIAHSSLQLLAPWVIATIYLCALLYPLSQYRRHPNSRGWLWTAIGVSYAVLIVQYVNLRYATLYGDKYYLANNMVIWFKLWWIVFFLVTIATVLVLNVVLFIAWRHRSADE